MSVKAFCGRLAIPLHIWGNTWCTHNKNK